MAGAKPGPVRTGPTADSDVYTALLCIAFLFLLAATVYVGYRAMTVFGGLLPPGGN